MSAFNPSRKKIAKEKENAKMIPKNKNAVAFCVQHKTVR